MKFMFIDGDEENQKLWREWAESNGHSAITTDNVFDANRFLVDFYVFDISAIAPINLFYTMYSPIYTLREILCMIVERLRDVSQKQSDHVKSHATAENHPNSVMVIVSGVAKSNRNTIIEEVKHARPETLIVDGGCGSYSEFETAISKFL